ncbi:hypothetical protein OOZ51_00470 [Arthrobacter sp. MI7-26]|uniref:hypothetical protein n=1 Tax=Arthrobacter sp. MI7-26 TaxID=2993653 RepID=UPI0022495D77|nr:hypothetical protein [Arthrobacter sp. MI7-26]MCX2746286.1 hypothetical protein [Arthrobacter sp. MI7-26]
MAGICVFCGQTKSLTREHVFGDWLGRIDLDRRPALHVAGPINRSPRDMGTTPPFLRTVKDVCGSCNNGWMSQLEKIAERVLNPFILGEPGAILAASDQGALSAWTHKTALVAMLVSTADDRKNGYGLPADEYRHLYEQRMNLVPTPKTQFWIGRYDGVARQASVWVAPLTVGRPWDKHQEPHGYLMTVLLGKAVLQRVRFTHPGPQLDLNMGNALTKIWPSIGDVGWPLGNALEDNTFVNMAGGRNVETDSPDIEVGPWRPATDLSASEEVGLMIRLPTPCGKHAVFYPGLLAREAQGGARYAFTTSCEREMKAYLVCLGSDGAHFMGEGAPRDIQERYDSISGSEYILSDQQGRFVVKQILDMYSAD